RRPAVPRPIPATESEKAGSDDRVDAAPGSEVGPADRTRFTIGEEEPLPIRGQAARLRECGAWQRIIVKGFRAAPCPRCSLQVRKFQAPDLMAPRHGDVEDIAQ